MFRQLWHPSVYYYLLVLSDNLVAKANTGPRLVSRVAGLRNLWLSGGGEVSPGCLRWVSLVWRRLVTLVWGCLVPDISIVISVLSLCLLGETVTTAGHQGSLLALPVERSCLSLSLHILYVSLSVSLSLYLSVVLKQLFRKLIVISLNLFKKLRDNNI